MHTQTTGQGAQRRRDSRWLQRRSWPVLALLGGCVTTKFEDQTVIPEPLVTRIPVVVGVYMPVEFREAVHREKRDGGEFAIAVGKAQSPGRAFRTAMKPRNQASRASLAPAALDRNTYS